MRYFPDIEKKLLVLKALLFGFYGALGSLWPFLTLHMMHMGFSLEDAAIVNLVLPFVAATCKPLIGIVADKTAKYQMLLAILLIMCGASYTSLLLIPPVDVINNHPSPIPSKLRCSHQGASVITEECPFQNCNTTQSQWYTITIQSCLNLCNNNTAVSIIDYPMNLCFQNNNITECIVPKNDSSYDALLKPCYLSEHDCELHSQQYKLSENYFDNLKCSTPTSECHVIECLTSIQSHHLNDAKPSRKTFWIYLIVRCIAEMILSSCYPLTDSINLSMCSQYGGYFGQQQLFGIFALGLFGPVTGAIVDYIQSTTGKANYSPCFYMFDGLVIWSVIMIVVIPVKVEKPAKKKFSMTKHFIKFLRNPAVILLFVAALLLGVIWGFMETFLYWYLLQLGATRMLIGLTQLVSVVPALPLLYISNSIVTKFGYVNVLILAFFVYCVRCVGYVFLKNPWWSLLLESTRIFSLYLARLSLTIYASVLSPPELKVTVQATVFLLHFDIGRGVGSLVGGLLMEKLGAHITFQIVAVYAGSLGCLYILLQHFCLKDKMNKTNQDRKMTEMTTTANVPQTQITKNHQQEPLLVTAINHQSSNHHHNSRHQDEVKL